MIQDKTFLHKKHSSYVKGKFHLKLNIRSNYLNLKTRVEANKIIYKLLDQEIKKFIHSLESIEIVDKTFLHKKHKGHQEGKFHVKIIISSKELTKLSKIESSKKIYKILDEEIRNYIHSIEIFLN